MNNILDGELFARNFVITGVTELITEMTDDFRRRPTSATCKDTTNYIECLDCRLRYSRLHNNTKQASQMIMSQIKIVAQCNHVLLQRLFFKSTSKYQSNNLPLLMFVQTTKAVKVK